MHTRYGLIAIAIGVGLLLGAAHPAYATRLSTKDMVYRSADLNCTELQSTIDGGTGSGYFELKVWSWQAIYFPVLLPCTQALYRPPGHIIGKPHGWKWDGSQWSLCFTTDYLSNSQDVYILTVYTQPDHVLCGDGWYSTQSYGYVWVNNQWYGGALWSPSRWIP